MKFNIIKEVAPTIQSVLVSLAIISGGLWAIITQTQELSSSINVSMTAEQVLLPEESTSKKTILVEVVTQSTGGQVVEYNFAQTTLSVSKQIPVDDQNTYKTGQKLYVGKFVGEETPPNFGRLAPDGKIIYKYAVLVDAPGLYSILFKAIPIGSKDERSFYFSAREAIVVK
ncbi:hypothetical protein [Neptunomonas qingdaonensis]|uniref:Uncharacterized protein n=1 Tax=Neptunomonas qingdaonensis TaxID=1045558 RepID=A0A1I2LNB1_9GAMM|nr:hypothetical protein [Neptunomonas qingdaonensis]SFF79950.1 hypothetical protein SAMN05216175_101102 [Neptunomonas qingdaonensis]